MSQLKGFKKQTGILLIEVLVVSTIIAIGLTGLGSIVFANIRSLDDTRQQTVGIWLVNDFAERIKANADGAKKSFYVFAQGQDCQTVLAPAAMCSDLSVGNTEGVNCGAQQMANFDIWNAVCGQNADKDTQDSQADIIRQPTLSSVCALTDGGECVAYSISLSWDQRASSNEGASAQIIRNSYTTVVEIL